MEEWRDVQGYEGLYQVSDQGRVRNVRRGRILKPHIVGAGYAQTTLSDRGSRRYLLIHRLVAQAFIPNPESKPQINHKNGIKTDNRVENLEWCTLSENLLHRHRVLHQQGGCPKQVVCLENGRTYPSIKDAAQALGVGRVSVLRVCWGQQKATRNKLHFKFKED